METLTPEAPRQTTPGRSRRQWLIIVVVIVVLAGIAVGIWAIIEANQADDTGDLAVATELADTWMRGWDENDAEAVRSVFTEDAVYFDDVGFAGGRTWTVEETVADVGFRGSVITNVSRIGELTPTDHGTFIFVAEFDAQPRRYSGSIEIELEGDLASRIEWLNLEVIDP
jgi:hypothetical protein